MLVVYYFVREHMGEKKDCINILVYGISDRSIATLTRLGNLGRYKVVGFVSPNDFDLDKRISSLRYTIFARNKSSITASLSLVLGILLPVRLKPKRTEWPYPYGFRSRSKGTFDTLYRYD